MSKYERHQTKYPGVYYIIGKSKLNGKPEKIYYILYRKDNKKVEERVGRQYKDAMTAAKASHIRTDKINGRAETNINYRKQRDERVTLDFLFKKFVEHKQKLRSIKHDISRYKNHIQPIFGSRIVKDIKLDDFYKLRVNLEIRYKPQSIKHIIVLLRRIVNFGVKLNLCSPIQFSIEVPKFDNRITEDMTEEQQKKIISVLNEYESYHSDSANIMRLALFTGLRKGMIFGLKWTDIDFERGFINIRDEEAKSKVAERIPMNDFARGVLNSITHRGSEYVFPNKSGGRLHKDAYIKHFRRIRERAGLPDNFRPIYGLRHTFASSAASSGEIDLYTLQKLMTHKSPEMTQRYAHLRDKALLRASDTMGAMFRKLTSPDDEDK